MSLWWWNYSCVKIRSFTVEAVHLHLDTWTSLLWIKHTKQECIKVVCAPHNLETISTVCVRGVPGGVLGGVYNPLLSMPPCPYTHKQPTHLLTHTLTPTHIPSLNRCMLETHTPWPGECWDRHYPPPRYILGYNPYPSTCWDTPPPLLWTQWLTDKCTNFTFLQRCLQVARNTLLLST